MKVRSRALVAPVAADGTRVAGLGRGEVVFTSGSPLEIAETRKRAIGPTTSAALAAHPAPSTEQRPASAIPSVPRVV